MMTPRTMWTSLSLDSFLVLGEEPMEVPEPSYVKNIILKKEFGSLLLPCTTLDLDLPVALLITSIFSLSMELILKTKATVLLKGI